MLALQTNRMIWLHAAMTALAVAAGTASAFAQQPPLDVPRAGALPGPSSGCEPGVAAGSLYTPSGQATGPSTSGNANSAGLFAGTPTDYTVPLYTNPNAGVNTPLYSSPLEGDNVPLYGTPVAGQNAPLYTTPTLLGPYASRQSPYTSTANIQPASCHSGIPVGSWLVYPSLTTYTIYSDNLFLAPVGRVNAWGIGETPTVTAEWTNGIHTSTIFADVNTQQYPTDNPINSFDRKAN